MTTRSLLIAAVLCGLVVAVSVCGVMMGWNQGTDLAADIMQAQRKAYAQGWSAGARAVAGYLMPGYEDEVIEAACEEQHKQGERSER